MTPRSVEMEDAPRNPPGGGTDSHASSRPPKRQRTAQAAEAPEGSVAGAELARAHSNVASSAQQQVDPTDSTGGGSGEARGPAAGRPQRRAAARAAVPPPLQAAAGDLDAAEAPQAATVYAAAEPGSPTVAAPAPPAPPPPPSPPAAPAAATDGAADADAGAGPPAKRRRAGRGRGPPPVRREDLRVADRASGPARADTAEGHYSFSVGDNLTPRFKVMRKFGEGTFGRVVEAWDRRRGGYVAVKIIRAVDKYRDAAMTELQVLATLAAADPARAAPVVRLLEWFDYRGHVCMVFERLGPSIYDALRRNGYRPFPLALARAFARQILAAVAFMHELAVVHTDLKPENILLLGQELLEPAPPGAPPPPPGSKLARRLPSRPDIRLIDFGSATFDADHHSAVVSTRHYRAPEIVLGLGWGRPCDLWSLGCIIVELLTGDALFHTHENLEHLAMMEAVLGPMPPGYAAAAAAKNAPGVAELFEVDGGARAGAGAPPPARLAWPGAAPKKSLRAVGRLGPLEDFLRAQGDAELGPAVAEVADLLRRLMAWEASARCSAAEALAHPFFANHPDDSGACPPLGPEAAAAEAAAAAASVQATAPVDQGALREATV
jgi:dual-specificity kinase